MAKKQNKNQMYLILGIVALALFYFGGQAGWFKGEFFSTTIDTTIQDRLDTQEAGNCYVTLDKAVINVGDEVGGIIRDGKNTLCKVYATDDTNWIKVAEGTTNVNGDLRFVDTIMTPGIYTFRVICGSCVTAPVTLKVNPLEDEDEELEVGDVVGSGGGNAVLGNEELSDFEIQLTAGDYEGDICAEIERKSSKVDPACNPTGDLEDWNNFIFLDSYTTVWTREDQIFSGVSVGPNTYGNPDVVSVSWDGVTPFHGFLHHFGTCDMNMEMRVTLKIC